MKEILVDDSYQKKAGKQSIDYRWWLKPEDKIHEDLFPLIKAIEQRQGYRRTQNLRHARLYSNLEILGLQYGMFGQNGNDSVLRNRVTLNVVKSCVDTAASKIAKAKPRAMFLTIDGDDKLQRRAQKLTRFMDGSFYEMGIYQQYQSAFTDAGVFGTGAVKFYVEQDKVRCERVLIDEIIVDDAEAIYGTPLQLTQSKFMSRDVLCSMFPEHEAAIMASSSNLPNELSAQRTADLVRTFETWKLPSSEGAKDGMHVIIIDNATLYAKPYKKAYFPFVMQRWTNKLTGFFGMGIPEELMGIQLEINKLLRTVQVAQHLMCVPRVFIENSSMINSQHINNEVASMVKYTNSPPIFNTAPAMPPEVYAHIENLYRKAYELTGISQLSATSQKPSGLDSGVALRTYQDIESDRFQLVGQRYEQAFLQGALMVVDFMRDLAKGNKDLTVLAKNGSAVERLNWSEVNLEDTDYEMRCFPVSMLPTTPEGKIQTVQELTQAGFIEKTQAMQLLDFPDLDAFMSIQTASLQITNKMVDTMLEDGSYSPPEPYMDLAGTIKYTQLAYLKARASGVGENNLELLRRFISDCETLIESATPEQPTMAMPGQSPIPVPTGAPAPQDVAQLLPNVGV